MRPDHHVPLTVVAILLLVVTVSTERLIFGITSFYALTWPVVSLYAFDFPNSLDLSSNQMSDLEEPVADSGQISSRSGYFDQPDKKNSINKRFFYFIHDPRKYWKSSSGSQALLDKSDFNYMSGSLGGHGYYEPKKEIHIHSTQPMHYGGGGKGFKEELIWPLLLLTFLPFVFGSLILLPILISFFTQILQLLALMQNTITNLSTTTQSPNSNFMGKRRRRRHISQFELEYYPYVSDEMIEQITQRLSQAIHRYQNLNTI